MKLKFRCYWYYKYSAPTDSIGNIDVIQKNWTLFNICLKLRIPFALSRLVLPHSSSFILCRSCIFTCLLCTLFRIKTPGFLDCDSACKPQDLRCWAVGDRRACYFFPFGKPLTVASWGLLIPATVGWVHISQFCCMLQSCYVLW